MDTWPPTVKYDWTQREKGRKGKIKAVFAPYPLLQGGALTSATLRENRGRFEWVTVQNQTSSARERVSYVEFF
jgi:hypothetical protein